MPRPVSRSARGYTLVEMLVVVAVIGMLLAVGAPVVSGLVRAGDVTRSAYTVMGVLEQARAHATSRNTYVWVGIFEEDYDGAEGSAGEGRLVLATVASKDGTHIYAEGDTRPGAFDPARLVQVTELVKVDHCHLDELTAAEVTRPVVPASNSQVGSTGFEVSGVAMFTSPLVAGSGSAYPFSKIIQFSPQGDATKVAASPSRWMEIGLRPTHGNVPDEKTGNLVAIQVAGIGGHIRLFRP